MKHKELVLGQVYWVTFPFKKGQLLPGTRVYRKVHLVDLLSGNRAVVQWDEITHDKPIGQPDRKVITRVRMATISCGTFMYSDADRQERGIVWDYKQRKLVLGPEQASPATLAGQTQMDALRRGHFV